MVAWPDLMQALKRFSPLWWAVVGANALLAVLLMVLLSHWWGSDEHKAAAALENGQRVLLAITDGAITGKPYIAQENKETLTQLPVSEVTTHEVATQAHEPGETAPEASDSTTPVANFSAIKEMREAPISALQETRAEGKVPLVSADGLTAWSEYGRAFILPAYHTRISLMITGLGLNKELTNRVIETMPAEVSLSFSPYAQDLHVWQALARGKGHEVWVDFALEPRDYPVSDPGPLGLNRRLSEEENLKRLYRTLARVPTAVGLYAPEEETFFSRMTVGRPIAQDIARRGVMLAYVNPKAIASTSEVKLPAGAPVWKALRIQRSLGENPSTEAVEAFFLGLEAHAREKGTAVGVLPAIPAVLLRLENWSQDLQEKNIALAPMTAFLSNPFVPGGKPQTEEDIEKEKALIEAMKAEKAGGKEKGSGGGH